MRGPRFSVLIPTYNRKKVVCEAVESILAQSFLDFEVFVIDDGSTDGTNESLRSYGDRIKVLNQSNKGPEVARNLAAAAASGEYLVLLDSDDLLMPWALQTYDHILRALDEPPVIIGSMIYFRDGKPLPELSTRNDRLEVMKYRDFLSKDLSVGLSNSRIVVRKSLYESVGGGRQTDASTFHLDDFHLVLKTGTSGPCVLVCAPATVAYRVHETNSVRSVASMVRGISTIIESERQGEFPGGAERKFERYACVGGISWRWVGLSWKAGHYRLALTLLLRSFPMVFAGMCRRALRNRRESAPIILS